MHFSSFYIFFIGVVGFSTVVHLSNGLIGQLTCPKFRSLRPCRKNETFNQCMMDAHCKKRNSSLICCPGVCGKQCVPGILVKPGECPDPGNKIGICVELCSGDADCRGPDKCCSNGCGHDCLEPLRGKILTCPVPSKRPCFENETIENCTSDDDCKKKKEKCCQGPCGLECMKGIWKKSGDCPKPKLAGLCVHSCNRDLQCPGNKKCCDNGCKNDATTGTYCVGPIPSVKAVGNRDEENLLARLSPGLQNDEQFGIVTLLNLFSVGGRTLKLPPGIEKLLKSSFLDFDFIINIFTRCIKLPIDDTLGIINCVFKALPEIPEEVELEINNGHVWLTDVVLRIIQRNMVEDKQSVSLKKLTTCSSKSLSDYITCYLDQHSTKDLLNLVNLIRRATRNNSGTRVRRSLVSKANHAPSTRVIDWPRVIHGFSNNAFDWLRKHGHPSIPKGDSLEILQRLVLLVLKDRLGEVSLNWLDF